MNQPETEISYYVVYQKPGDTNWYTFTNTRDLFKHARDHGPYNSTTNLDEALAAAQGLVDRTVFVDSRPEYQDKLSAARVIQLVQVGAAVFTYGAPQGDE